VCLQQPTFSLTLNQPFYQPFFESMADSVALGAAFTRMGFNTATRNFLLNREKFTIEKLQELSDEDADKLLTNMRKLNQPDAPEEESFFITTQVDTLFKTACFIGRHHKRTARVLTADFLTDARLVSWQQPYKAELKHKEPTEHPTLVKADPSSVLAFIDSFPQKLDDFLGVDGCPLSYVIRNVIAVPPVASDPTVGEPNCRYVSIHEEVVARTPIPSTFSYPSDNARVFKILHNAVEQFPSVHVHVKRFARTGDGRSAWMTLKRVFILDCRKIATLERQLAALKKNLAEDSHSDSDGSGNPNTKKKKKG
jgi:hypothetical protein